MRACAPPAAAARCAAALPRRCSAAARSSAPQAPPAVQRTACPRRRRSAVRCRAAGDAERDNEPWWMALDELFVLTFDAGSDDEGIYTTSTTEDGEAVRHAFVAFQDAAAAASLAARVAAQAGRACAVQGVPPLALLLLGREAGFTVEAVPRGAPWERPDILLQAGPPAQAAAQEAQPDVAQAMAQRAAATAVRNALLLPLSQLSGSLARAAGMPAGATLQPPPGDEPPPAMPQAASAMAAALRAIARRRLESLLPPTDAA